jgi:hypothetical protein
VKTIEEKKAFLAYKLLEWAGTLDDRQSYDKLPKSQIENAVKEAEHILDKLEG